MSCGKYPRKNNTAPRTHTATTTLRMERVRRVIPVVEPARRSPSQDKRRAPLIRAAEQSYGELATRVRVPGLDGQARPLEHGVEAFPGVFAADLGADLVSPRKCPFHAGL